MSTSIKNKIKSTPFLNAILDKSTLIFEKLETIESVLNELEEGTIHTGHVTNTLFELGVPKEEKNTSFQIRVGYSVELLLNKNKIKFCSYESKIYLTFELQDHDGFDWKDVPPKVLSPYFSFAHSIARRRAEEHLLAAGYPGIVLPLPGNLKIDSKLD